MEIKHGEWKNSLVEGKNPCRNCQNKGNDKSGDNFNYFGEDRGGYCFLCHFTIPSKDNKNYKEEAEWEIDIMAKEFTFSQWKELKENCSPNPKGFRGLTLKTCESYSVQHEFNETTGEVERQYYPNTKGYKYSGIKARCNPKNFYALGGVGKECELFGQWKYRNSNSKWVIITAGELDCLSGHQMLEMVRKDEFEPTPVVSPTTGESSAVKQLQGQYEWLNRFEKIIICYDNDDAGQAAIDKIVKVLPKGKVHIMRIPLKDTNECLMKGKHREWVNAFWKAEKHTPSGILASTGLMEKIKEFIKLPKIPLPPFMFKLQSMMAGGIPLGTIINLASASGTGKSTIVDECTYYWSFNSPYKVGVVTLESDSAQYGINLLSRHLGKKINLIEGIDEKIALLDTPEVVEAANKLWYTEDMSPRFYIVEDRDGSVQEIKDLVTNLIISCDCKLIILDPVSDVLEGCSREEEALFWKWMKGMTKTYAVTFINVAHVRKSQGGKKANSTGADLHEEDMFGSSSSFKSAACNLLFTRDKESTDDILRNTTKMKATKIRWTGKTGIGGEYYYCNETHTVYDKDWYFKNKDHLADF